MANPNPPLENLKPFKPGQSGNPAGTKPGTKHLSTHIQEMLNDPDFELKLKDGTVLKGAPIKAILKTAIAKGVSGDMRAFDIMAKYGYGNKIDITTNGKDLPTPILKLDGVLRNNSDEENNQPQ